MCRQARDHTSRCFSVGGVAWLRLGLTSRLAFSTKSINTCWWARHGCLCTAVQQATDWLQDSLLPTRSWLQTSLAALAGAKAPQACPFTLPETSAASVFAPLKRWKFHHIKQRPRASSARTGQHWPWTLMPSAADGVCHCAAAAYGWFRGPQGRLLNAAATPSKQPGRPSVQRRNHTCRLASSAKVVNFVVPKHAGKFQHNLRGHRGVRAAGGLGTAWWAAPCCSPTVNRSYRALPGWAMGRPSCTHPAPGEPHQGCVEVRSSWGVSKLFLWV